MSREFSEFLSYNVDGTTPHAQAINAYLPAGQGTYISPYLLQVELTLAPSSLGYGSIAVAVICRPN